MSWSTRATTSVTRRPTKDGPVTCCATRTFPPTIWLFEGDELAIIQELARDKQSSEYARYDHTWPTSEKECKGMADHFSNSDSFWAVCLRDGGKLIGFIAFNSIDDGQLDLGHLFHSRLNTEGYATEAIRRIVDYAFTHLDVESIAAKNAEDWTAQVAPLRELGFRVKDRGKASFHKDRDGRPIEFTGCTMEMTKEEWLHSPLAEEQP